MVLIYDTLSNCVLHLYEVFQSEHEVALQMIIGNNSKNVQSSVMVLAHDKLSHCALQLYEVSSK